MAGMTRVALSSDLDEIADDLEDEVEDVLREQADKIAQTARDNLSPPFSAPGTDPHPGRLASSIEVVKQSERGFIGWRVVAGAKSDRNVPYAHMVEYGTEASGPRHTKPTRPHPFIMPAYEQYREESIKAVADVLDDLD